MQLDSEDLLPPANATGARVIDTPASPAHPAWFGASTPKVEIIVKKRRLAGIGPQPEAAPGSAAQDAGERRPRVFVLARDPTTLRAPAESSLDAANAQAATLAAGAMPSAVRRRRRRPSMQQPSPVVHIVLPSEAATLVSVNDGIATPAAADGPFQWQRPGFDEYVAVKAALGRLLDLVHAARAARAWQALPLPSARAADD